MATFNFAGTNLTLDWLISYARVSTSQQTGEHGAGGIERQLGMFREFSTAYQVPEDTSFRLVDDGRSASTGRHIKGGDLGMFLASIGSVKPSTALVIESFSRLTRLPTDEALDLFIRIVSKGDIPLITLQDRRVYTRASIRTDKGQIFQVAAAIQAARDLADNLAYYSSKAWIARRGSLKNITPSWIGVVNGEHAPDPVKAAVVLRIFHMALTMGAPAIARTLNDEGVPVFDERKRPRDVMVWNAGTIAKWLRGRQALGQQEFGKYIEGKREVVAKGQYVHSYPAVVPLDLWQQVQVKVSSRQNGIMTGRNVTRMANLWGDLARCECGDRMKIHRRGAQGQYVYLGCSNHYVGQCDNGKYYRADKIERLILPRIAVDAIEDKPTADPATILEKQLATARSKAAQIEVSHHRSMSRSGALAERTQTKLEADYQRQTENVTKLERQLATLRSAPPVADVQRAIRGRLGAALLGDVAARTKIAASLPEVVRRLTCRKDGSLRLEFKKEKPRIRWTFSLDPVAQRPLRPIDSLGYAEDTDFVAVGSEVNTPVTGA